MRKVLRKKITPAVGQLIWSALVAALLGIVAVKQASQLQLRTPASVQVPVFAQVPEAVSTRAPTTP